VATTKSPENVAAAWLKGEKPTVSYKTLFADTVNLTDTLGPEFSVGALVSYGHHYVAAFKRGAEVWVNTEDYFPDDYDRRNWHQSPFTTSRCPKFSPTTRRHLCAITTALLDAGYAMIPGEIETGINGHSYRLWSDSYCQYCEEAPVKPGTLYCCADCADEAFTEEVLWGYMSSEDYIDCYSDADPGL
jgi:hypothetical protein